MTELQASNAPASDSTEAALSRAELEALSSAFREMKHAVNNTFAVFMALSEVGQRNPAHLEKLSKAVLQRSPEIVAQLSGFGERLGGLVKQMTAAS